MSDAVWAALVGSVAAGIVAVLVAWLREVVTSTRRHRQLERLEICVRLRRDLADDDVASVVIEREFENLVAALEGSNRRRPIWWSVVQFIFGLFAVWIPAAFLYLVFFPETQARPWGLVALLIPAFVIYAIESQPLFLRPIIGRWAPGRPRAARSKAAGK